MASTTYSVSRDIQAPPEVVWALLTNPPGYQEWNPAVLRIDGAMSPGGVIKLVSIASPQRTFSLRVTSMQAPESMTWSDVMPFGLFRGVRTYRLGRVDSGTSFSMTEEFTGALAGLITKSIPDLTPSFDIFADGLKAAAEAAASH